jgi:hypothetical protein
MFLQPGLKEFNSRARSISPFPTTTFNQFCSGSQDNGSPATESPMLPFSDEGSSYLSSSSGDFSMVSLLSLCIYFY